MHDDDRTEWTEHGTRLLNVAKPSSVIHVESAQRCPYNVLTRCAKEAGHTGACSITKIEPLPSATASAPNDSSSGLHAWLVRHWLIFLLSAVCIGVVTYNFIKSMWRHSS